MKPNRPENDGALTGVPGDEVARLATKAIAAIFSQADGRGAAAAAQLLLPCNADLSEGREVRQAVLSRMRDKGTPVPAIIDRIIPKVARHVDLHPHQIAEMVRKSRDAMVGIAPAGRRTLASAGEFADTIRASVTRVSPIVRGASVVTSGLELRHPTGADHIIRDVPSAIRLCGVRAETEVRVHVAL